MRFDNDFDHFPKHQRRSFRWLQGIIGGIIGGVVVALMLPLLTTSPRSDAPRMDNAPMQYDEVVPRERFTQVKTDTTRTARDVSAVVAAVQDTVVGVVNLQKGIDFWTRKDEVIQAGTGSGVIFDRQDHIAHIVTNYHVVEGAKEVEVVLASGERVPAEIKGVDPLTDLAVLAIRKFESTTEPIVLGDSEALLAGEPAIAIGNPLGLDFSRTVTVGVISSTQRSIPQDVDGNGTIDWEMDVIQTDAAINPGNSGGALLNDRGELIGINSAKISEVGIEGMGFAIPINEARPLMFELLERGHIRRPYIGLTPKDLQEINAYHWDNSLLLPADQHTGVVIIDVARRGPAAAGGLAELDVIVALDGIAIDSSADLRAYLYKNKKAGDPVEVTYYREGRRASTTVVLNEMDIPH